MESTMHADFARILSRRPRIVRGPLLRTPADLRARMFFERGYGDALGSSDEAIAKLAAGAVNFDVIIGLSGSNIVNLIAQQLLRPLNHALLPKLEKNVWPQLQDPFYDGGSRYTVPYVVWLDGIGWRNDKVREDVAAMDVPWDIFWQS